MADDFEDDFVLDPSVPHAVAAEEGAGATVHESDLRTDDKKKKKKKKKKKNKRLHSEAETSDGGDDDVGGNDEAEPSTKRQRVDGDEEEGEELDAAEIARRKNRRKKRQARFAKLKAKRAEKMANDPLNMHDVETAAAEAQAALWWGVYCDAMGNKLTTVEMEKGLEASAFVSLGDSPRTDRDLLPSLTGLFDSASALTKAPHAAPVGAPLVLIISSSAIRSANVYKLVASLNSDRSRVAKLFAKHFKIKEQVSFLAQHHIRVAVGTPNRLNRLADLDALDLGGLQYVMIDTTRDAKGFNVFDVKQIKDDLFELYKNHIHERVDAGDTKLILF